MIGVAWVAHEALGFDWAPAFVLGAIVSPTDPVAATAIARRLGVPNRIVTIVEGESLINDGTALVAYKFAVDGRRRRHVQPLRGERRLRHHRGRRHRRRHRRRRDHRLRPPPHRRPRRRGDDRPVQRLLRLPAGRGDRRLRRARRGHRRHLHGPADLGADDADDQDPGRGGLGDRPVPAQLGAVRPRRPAAARDPRRDRRHRHLEADPRRRC